MRYVATDFADESGEDRVGEVLAELDRTAGRRAEPPPLPRGAAAGVPRCRARSASDNAEREGWTRVIVEKPFGTTSSPRAS